MVGILGYLTKINLLARSLGICPYISAYKRISIAVTFMSFTWKLLLVVSTFFILQSGSIFLFKEDLHWVSVSRVHLLST